ncbi:MAG: hypothetical protein COW08_04020 [Ignavibacteriales bacterium CG12_big_fil_rev_8_21_14_0_65_30_8]|nr:MAG: hypothetical protein COW08_04020 [Ignavibacteriales bacterium CG12_big_fil_rev_8_21_14_0_65_30_8]
MKYRINANADTAAVAGDQILNGSDVSSILNIILGLTPIAPPSASTNLQITLGNLNVTGLGHFELPINFNNSSNMNYAEIKFNYDPALIDFQSFASQLVASGNYVNAQERGPGEAYFFFAAGNPINGNFNPGDIILKFNNGTMPIGSEIHTSYRMNGVDWQTGPTIKFSLTTIEDSQGLIPNKFELSQNYPNPFNPSTNIRFSLPEASFVSIKIYNMLGQEIKTLVNKQKNPGIFKVQWNGDNDFGQKVSSGTYIYRVVAGSRIFAKKMVLLK